MARQFLYRENGVTGFDEISVSVGDIPDAEITFAKIQNADALSVLGRSANTSGVLDEIAAGSDHQVLRRSGTSIGFGAVNLAQAAAVTGDLPFANIAQITGQAVLGVATAGAGDLAAISAGTDDRILRQTSGSLNFGQLTAGMFPNTIVPDAALSTNVPLKDARNVFTINTIGTNGDGAVAVAANTPVMSLRETDGGTDDKVWLWYASGEAMRFATVKDDATSVTDFIIVDRTDATVDGIQFKATNVGVTAGGFYNATAARQALFGGTFAAGDPVGAAAVEIGISSGVGAILSYNRNSSAYVNLLLSAAYILLDNSGGALGNYANDAAAAAGGVPIKGMYRNGSVLMVRVA